MLIVENLLNCARRDAQLTSSQLKRLSEHKYSAQDSSICDELFMQKFWTWLVSKYPLWVAPNVITLVGLVFNVVSTLILSYFSPDGKGEAPRWCYFLCAITLFIYQSLDATDGKQARRTNSASPLGELFDHGCDSLSQTFVSLEVCLSIQLGVHPSLLLYFCTYAVALFYIAHWQTYVSGTLRFGRFDVTEAQFAVIAVCLVSGIFGPETWAKEILGLELRLILIFGCSIVALYSTYCNLYVVFTGGVGKYGSTVADSSVIFPVFPLAMFVLPAIVIFGKSTTGLFEQNLVLYCTLYGLVSAKITNRLVVAHMTRSELQLWDSVMLGPLALMANQYFDNVLSEYLVLLTATMYCAINLTCCCTLVCRQICDYLKIQCFRIPYPAPAAPTSGKVAKS